MLIKAADDKTADLDALRQIAARHAGTATASAHAARQILIGQSAIRSAAEAAQEIDSLYGDSKNWMVIHDLRLEFDNRTIEIDHLLVNRMLEIYLCESRAFGDGVAIDEQGEFSAFVGLDTYPIPSPLELNRRRIGLLLELFDTGRIALPQKDGAPLAPTLNGMILLARRARISRPKRLIPGIECMIKCDQLNAYLERRAERAAAQSTQANAVDPSTLEQFARRIAAAHRPAEIDWAARLPPAPPEPRPAPPPILPALSQGSRSETPRAPAAATAAAHSAAARGRSRKKAKARLV